jgi:hypothetical protein
MKIIKQRERVHVERYMLGFDNADGRGGYSFECDKDGTPHKLDNPAAIANYNGCISGKYDVIARGVEDWSYDYTSPKVGLCDCGKEVQLDHFTNTCYCGRDYNSSGTLLAPRECWGEETGESVADILRIP